MLSFFQRDVLDEILNLIESVSEGYPTYSLNQFCYNQKIIPKDSFVTSEEQRTFHLKRPLNEKIHIF